MSKPPVSNIRFTLTLGQKLKIVRRRLSMSQREAAEYYKVPHKRYRYWELDQYTDEAPRVSIGSLLPHEKCWLLRLQSGMTQEELAKKICFSRYHVHKMETGQTQCDILVEWWHERAA